MAKVETDLIIEAITKGFDKVSKDLEKVGKSTGEVEKETKKASKGIGAFDVALGNLASGALMAAGDAIVDFVKGSIDLASSVQETASLIDNSLGPAAEGFRASIEQIAEATNRSSVELEAGSSTIIAMTRSMGMGQEAAATYSATMAQIATDLGSFFNQSTEQVFQDLQAALGGSSETMQKYGIDVRETQLKNIALEQGLISQGETLDRVTRAQIIQSEVLRQAADAMGDAERTSDSYENTQRGLQAAVLDLQVTIGNALIPVLTELAQEAIPAVEQAAEDAGPALEAFGQGLLDAFSEISQSTQIAALQNQLKDAGLSVKEFGQVTRISSADLGTLVTGIFDAEARSRQYQKEILAMELAMEALSKGLQAGTDEFYAYIDAQFTATQKAEALNEANKDLIDSEFNLEDAITSNKDATEELGEAQEETERATAALSRAITRAEQENHTYEVSADQVKDAEEARAEAHEEAAKAAEEAAEAMEELAAATGDYFVAALEAEEGAGFFNEALSDLDENSAEVTVNQDNVNQALFAAADAAGASATELAILGGALGLYSDEALDAALKSAIIQEAINTLAGSFVDGTMSIDDVRGALDDLITTLENPPPPLVIETNVEEATEGLTAAETMLADKLGVFEAESQGLSEGASSAFEEIASSADTNMTAFQESVDAAMGGASESSATNMAELQTSVTTGMTGSVAAAQAIVPEFQAIGTSIWQGMVAGVQAGQGPLSAAVAAIVTAAIEAGKEAAEASSPAEKPKREIGLPISQGIAEGVIEGGQAVADAVATVVGDAITATSGGMLGAGATFAEALFNGMQAAGVQFGIGGGDIGTFTRMVNMAANIAPGGFNASTQVNAAKGADFIVPPRYPNDTFTIGATSGERVTITPPGQMGMNGGGINIGSLTVNGTPSMNENQLADKVIRRIGREARKRRNSRATGARF